MKDGLAVLIASGNRNETKALRELVDQAGGFRTAGTVGAAAGLLELIRQTSPDVVLLDIDGFSDDPVEQISAIMRQEPVPIVLMSSERGALKAVEGIAAGALTVVRRPALIDLKPDRAPALLLLKTLRTYAGVQVIRHVHGRDIKAKSVPRTRPRAAGIIVIASSTGGPNALKTILAALPADLPTGVVVAQHITQGFTPGLVQWLDKASPLRVKLAEHGETIQPGVVYFAPDEYHIVVKKGNLIGLDKAGPIDGHRPSCNRLLRSAAQVYGDRTTGVILSGMGEDGAQGLLEIKREGGQTIAQDEATCVVFGMPRAAVENGAVARTTALAGIAGEILRLAQ